MATTIRIRSKRVRRLPQSPPLVDPERLRVKAIEELLRLISQQPEAGMPFELSPAAHAVVDQLRGRPRKNLERDFAYQLLRRDGPVDYLQANGTPAVQYSFIQLGIGIPWDDVLAGLSKLAMGARLDARVAKKARVA